MLFLQTMAITPNLTVNMDSPNLKRWKIGITLVSSDKIRWYIRFFVPVATTLDCSRSDHQGHTPTCLRWFLETFYPYLSPYQISKTCLQCTIRPLYDIFLPCYLPSHHDEYYNSSHSAPVSSQVDNALIDAEFQSVLYWATQLVGDILDHHVLPAIRLCLTGNIRRVK